jgi:hypothetical protein
MQINIPRAALQAMTHLCTRNDIRYYLNGVMLETLANEARLVATDGSVMGVYRMTDCSFPEAERGQMILPLSAVDLALKAAAKTLPIQLQVTQGAAGPVHMLGAVAFTPVEGRFPDYRRAIPREVSGVATMIDPALLARFAKACDCLAPKAQTSPVRIGHNGVRNEKGGREDRGAIVECAGVPGFAGVVMPLRFEDVEYPKGAPAWVYER